VNADVTATKPRTLILLLMKRCNLRCDFCDLWHHTDLMPYEHAATILLRAPAAGIKTVVLTGGEPFVHPRIWDIIELAKNLGLGVNITTNGTLLRRDLGRLGRARIDSLSVSLDGWEETHERLRGVPGCFRESVDAIEAIRAQTAIWVNVYFVVTNQNVSELRRVFDWTRDRGLGFDFWPVNGYPHLYITSPDDRRAYLDAIDHIAQHSTAVLERIDYYRYGLEYMAGRRDHLRCLGLVEQMGVNHQGKLVPCCVWDQKGLQVGSALDEPLDQLLHSRRAQRLRKAIVEEGCVDQCLNHSLYEFQAATGLPFVVKPAERELDVELAVLKQSGQARAGEAKARKRAEARARRVPA
jgi:MoaA/NifB/PqqE/SkfB family radical SAM enzyme